MPEKFSTTELTTLRGELLKGNFDSFQMAEAIKTFVTGYGYGISIEGALNLARSLPSMRGSVRCLSTKLEALVFVM
jgi:hypothetical protein